MGWTKHYWLRLLEQGIESDAEEAHLNEALSRGRLRLTGCFGDDLRSVRAIAAEALPLPLLRAYDHDHETEPQSVALRLEAGRRG